MARSAKRWLNFAHQRTVGESCEQIASSPAAADRVTSPHTGRPWLSNAAANFVPDPVSTFHPCSSLLKGDRIYAASLSSRCASDLPPRDLAIEKGCPIANSLQPHTWCRLYPHPGRCGSTLRASQVLRLTAVAIWFCSVRVGAFAAAAVLHVIDNAFQLISLPVSRYHLKRSY